MLALGGCRAKIQKCPPASGFRGTHNQNMNTNEAIHRATKWSIVISVLMIVVGLFAIIVPEVFGAVVVLLLGWLLVLGGAVHLAYAWHIRHHHGSGLWWGILMSIIYIAIGIYLLVHPAAGLASLTLILAIYLFMEAAVELMMSFHLRRVKGSGWLMFDGIVTFILAVLILKTWPSSSAWVIGTLIGISILFSGITRLMFSTSARRAHSALNDAAKSP
jgi:uncharacterized membrane protein HdeD (DUF308 family)